MKKSYQKPSSNERDSQIILKQITTWRYPYTLQHCEKDRDVRN